MGGWEKDRGCQGHPHRLQPGSTVRGCCPMAGVQHVGFIRPHAWLWLAMSCREGGMQLGAVGQKGGCVPDHSSQVERCCPQGSHVPTHTSRAHIIMRVGAGSLCGHHIPHASMTLLPIMPCTPVMSCSTTAATSHPGPQSPPAPLRHCATSCSKGLHTSKAPQSSDMVTSQYPMTSCCLCPSNITLPFWPFPGCHSFTHQGR